MWGSVAFPFQCGTIEVFTLPSASLSLGLLGETSVLLSNGVIFLTLDALLLSHWPLKSVDVPLGALG